MVVVEEHDHRVFQFAGSFQFVKKILHGSVKVHAFGKVALHRVGIIGMNLIDLIQISCAKHGVFLIRIMHGRSDDRGHEFILIDEFGNGQLHQFQIRLPAGQSLNRQIVIVLVNLASLIGVVCTSFIILIPPVVEGAG